MMKLIGAVLRLIGKTFLWGVIIIASFKIVSAGVELFNRTNAGLSSTNANGIGGIGRVYGTGDDVVLDGMRWKVVIAGDLGSTLASSNQFISDVTTSGHFVVVQFDVENLGTEALYYEKPVLVDSQGRSFEASNEVLFLIPDEMSCLLENLNPNVEHSCLEIYDVPNDATNLRAKVGNLQLIGKQTALITLDVHELKEK